MYSFTHENSDSGIVMCFTSATFAYAIFTYENLVFVSNVMSKMQTTPRSKREKKQS